MIDSTLDFHQFGEITKEEIIFYLNQFIEESYQNKSDKILIITGKEHFNNLSLRHTVFQELKKNKRIKSFKTARLELGGSGAFEVYI